MGELVIFIMGKIFFQLKSFKLGTQDGQTKTFIEKKAYSTVYSVIGRELVYSR